MIATARGNRLHLRFEAKHGVSVEQWISLAADGRSARNLLVARKLGLRVAALGETIRELDRACRSIVGHGPRLNHSDRMKR